MPTLTLLRPPAGKLGCRISADDRVSEVHAGGAAELAGLKVGWLVKSINGKPVSALPDLIKQSVFKFVMEVDEAPPRKESKAGQKRKSTAEPKASPKEPKAPEPNVPSVAPQKTAEPQKKASPKASAKVPQRYVYLVWHTHDRVGNYPGDGTHSATVCAVYDNEEAAQQHADELGGEEDDDDEYTGRYGGEERSSATVVRAPVLASFSDPRSRQDVCDHNCDD